MLEQNRVSIDCYFYQFIIFKVIMKFIYYTPVLWPFGAELSLERIKNDIPQKQLYSQV